MNDVARNKLVQAQLDGVNQIRYHYSKSDGKCAMGVLGFRVNDNVVQRSQLFKEYGFNFDDVGYMKLSCPGECGKRFTLEADLVVHLNDDHEWDFLTIARKMP